MSSLKQLTNSCLDAGKRPEPNGILIINGASQEIFVPKKLIAGFGYETAGRQRRSLEPKTFHQIINSDLPRKLKGRGKVITVLCLGPDPKKMGPTNAASFQNFMKVNGLGKGQIYKVIEVTKEVAAV